MNILIVNGSPKGKYSITLQTGKYLELLYPEHKFEVIHAGQIIKKLQRDFTPAKEMLERADLVIFFLSCIYIYCTVTASLFYRSYEEKRS